MVDSIHKLFDANGGAARIDIRLIEFAVQVVYYITLSLFIIYVDLTTVTQDHEMSYCNSSTLTQN